MIKPPADLTESGRAFHRKMVQRLNADNVELDPHEIELFHELCRTLDRLSSLRDAIEDVEVTAPAYTRLLGEERQQRMAMGRTVAQLGWSTGLPNEEEQTTGRSARSRAAQKAARTRWANGA